MAELNSSWAMGIVLESWQPTTSAWRFLASQQDRRLWKSHNLNDVNDSAEIARAARANDPESDRRPFPCLRGNENILTQTVPQSHLRNTCVFFHFFSIASSTGLESRFPTVSRSMKPRSCASPIIKRTNERQARVCTSMIIILMVLANRISIWSTKPKRFQEVLTSQNTLQYVLSASVPGSQPWDVILEPLTGSKHH